MAEKKKVMKKSEAAPKKRAPRVKKSVEIPLKAAPAPVVAPVTAPVVKKAPKPKALPKAESFAGTGRRKTATARVYLFQGSGKITVNSKPYEEYFCKRQILLNTVLKPLKEINMVNNFDIHANVFGGGVPSQADAIRLGIARALVAFNPQLRAPLRTSDLLMRDPRVKERKKYGLKRARRAFQYTKR